ncbi:hypothetical protein O6H91_21G071000 [Diphasiastrum complanatum]|uniref:Uncharacterized protein n=1 Tax=Diphasiastrum complanatum TaxID=34168 RepID=A0ACC2ALY1_DIPCM|nr:hypothetical protein O6H91_21G071000 [Diphasiastrum complanatum]
MAASFYDNFVVAKDGSVESIRSYEARIKPRKTRSKGPALVFAFTEVERQKLEQEKASYAEYKKSVMAKIFFKLATFSYLKNMRLSGGSAAENSAQLQSPRISISDSFPPSSRIMHNSSTTPDSKVVRAHSLPTASGARSALKDRFEETGSCQRSKQHVKWASDIEDSIDGSNKISPEQLPKQGTWEASKQ